MNFKVGDLVESNSYYVAEIGIIIKAPYRNDLCCPFVKVFWFDSLTFSYPYLSMLNPGRI